MTDLICAGPHTNPVVLGHVEETVPYPLSLNLLCGECGDAYRLGIAGLLEGLKVSRGQIPPLDVITAAKRREIPDWTPTRDNYGPKGTVR